MHSPATETVGEGLRELVVGPRPRRSAAGGRYTPSSTAPRRGSGRWASRPRRGCGTGGFFVGLRRRHPSPRTAARAAFGLAPAGQGTRTAEAPAGTSGW